MKVLDFKPAEDQDNESVTDLLEKLIVTARENDVVGCAVVLLARNNTTYVSSHGRGRRVPLLGAVADLQYTLARDGDR